MGLIGCWSSIYIRDKKIACLKHIKKDSQHEVVRLRLGLRLPIRQK